MPNPIDRTLGSIKNSKLTQITLGGGGAVFIATIGAGGINALSTVISVLAGTAAVGTQISLATAISTGFLIASSSLILIPIAATVLVVKNRKTLFNKKKELNVSDIKKPFEWDCFFTTVAILGIGRTGKTLLRKRLLGIPVDADIISGTTSNESTSEIEIQLAELDPKEKVYIAIVDNAGATQKRGKLPQRESLKEFLGIIRTIIVVLDHAETDPGKVGINNKDNPKADDNRLNFQEELIKTIKSCIDDEVKKGNSSLQQIILIMNKTDCWENKDDDNKIRTWFNNQIFNSVESDYKNHLDVFKYYMSIMKDNDQAPSYKEFYKRLVESAKQFIRARQ